VRGEIGNTIDQFKYNFTLDVKMKGLI